jgi:hypothetical protein
MLVWGYKGGPTSRQYLTTAEAKELLHSATPSAQVSDQQKEDLLENELNNIQQIKSDFDILALTRADKLIEAHERFRKAMGGFRFQKVLPVLPMDIIGIYILLPDIN